jgi:anti-sigma factor RsiW
VTACNDFDLLLSLRATGALEPAEAARVEAHLQGCAACRAEADADAAVLRLAALPPPSEAERRATAALARDTLAELHRREGWAASWKRAGAAFAAAAALLVAVLAPAMLGRQGLQPPPGAVSATSGATASAASWQEPDLDTLWSDTGVLDLSGASSSSDASDAAVASLDL